MRDRTFISFDWALKRLLRDKANFGVLEGFVSTILDKPVKIHRLLESEGNQDRDDAQMNRVDLLAEDESGELLLERCRVNRSSLIFSVSCLEPRSW